MEAKLRAEVVAYAAKSGIPEVAVAELLAHLRTYRRRGVPRALLADVATVMARKVIDLGWRPDTEVPA